MRRLSRAGIVPVLAASVWAISACGGHDRRESDALASARGTPELPSDTAPPAFDLSRSFLGQEAPPAVGRPTTGVIGDRMVQGETPGRWPFYWTRAIYSGEGGWYGRRQSWSTDFPKGDQQFLVVLKRLVKLSAYDWENAVHLANPDLRRFPILYAVEVGRMRLSDEEVEGLRGYLEAGGFLIVDDFWGTREWQIFEWNMARVFPTRTIEDIPIEHPLFSTFYDIEEIRQVPNISNARWGVRTHERDGYVPYVRGIFDDYGRLMVAINFNTDLGDAWEWAEDPRYPLEYSTFAYELGTNLIVYGLSH